MPQQKQQVEQNNFSGGFNTERSPINADPATTIQEQNMILASDGSRARRYGYNQEASNEDISLSTSPFLEAKAYFMKIKAKRIASAGNPLFEDPYFIIRNRQQVAAVRASEDYVFDTGTGVSSVSVIGGYDFDADMSDKTITIGGLSLVKSSVNGGIIAVTGGDSSVSNVLVSYLSGNYVRDFVGVDDFLEISERPSTLSENHAYNLLNQGWRPTAIAKFNTDIGAFPSNADVPYFGINTTDTYDTELLKSTPFPNGAPRGNYYIATTLMRRSRRFSVENDFSELNSLLGTSLNRDLLPGATQVLNDYYIQDIEGFLGRCFSIYATQSGENPDGDDTINLRNAITFSRIVDSTFIGTAFEDILSLATPLKNTAVACASTDNPTSQTFSPTASDGGIFYIDGAERLLGLYSTRQSLIIVASNGIWELVPQDGFSPQTFIVNKILSTRIQDTRGVVSIQGTIIVPTNSGMYSLSYDGQSRRSVANPLSDSKIRTWYLDNFRDIADGVWDDSRQEARWLIRTSAKEADAGNLITVEQGELVLDARTGAFSLNKFPSTQAYVYYEPNTGSATNRPTYRADVSAGSVPFIAGYATLEYAMPTTESSNTPVDVKRKKNQVKLLYTDPSATTSRLYKAADQAAELFTDFGTNVEAFLVTNPLTLGDTIRRKDIPWIWTHFYRTEDGFEDDGSGDWVPTNESGCLLSARWDFSDSTNSGKWTTPCQVYRYNKQYMPEDLSDPFDYGQSIITTKNNIAGSGKAVSLKFESDGDKDMQLIGWGAEIAYGASTS